MDRATLDRSLVKGVAWTGAVKWGAQILVWGVTLLVARLLTPEDYGLVGLAALYLGLVSLLSEAGLGETVLTFRALSRHQLGQLNTTGVFLGGIAAVLTGLLAKPVAVFFESPRLENVLLVLGFTFLISALGIVPGALMRRELRYKALALVEGSSQVLASASTLLMALMGAGYWALVLGQMVQLVANSIWLFVLAKQRFHLPRPKELIEAFTFGAHVIGARVSWYFYSNADHLVAGKFLGPGALGLYAMGFTLARLPVEKINGVLNRVTPGIFSAVQDQPASLCRYTLMITEAISLVTFGPILGLGLVAPRFIPFALGDQWSELIVPLQILTVGAAMSSAMPLLPQVLNILKDARFSMRAGIAAAVVFPIGFLVGSRWGITGIAAAYVLLYPLVVVLPLLIRVRKLIGLSPTSYFSAILPATTATFGMAAGVMATRALFPEGHVEMVHLLVEIATGVLGYFGTLVLFHRSRIRSAFRALGTLRT